MGCGGDGNRAVHPHRDGFDDAVDRREPDLTERQAEVFQCQTLEAGDALDVIVGIDGPSRPGVVGEGEAEDLRRSVEIVDRRSPDLDHVRMITRVASGDGVFCLT